MSNLNNFICLLKRRTIMEMIRETFSSNTLKYFWGIYAGFDETQTHSLNCSWGCCSILTNASFVWWLQFGLGSLDTQSTTAYTLGFWGFYGFLYIVTAADSVGCCGWACTHVCIYIVYYLYYLCRQYTCFYLNGLFELCSLLFHSVNKKTC